MFREPGGAIWLQLQDEVFAAKDLATKGDVLAVQKEVLAAKMELHKAMHDLKVSLIKWVIGLLFAPSALLYTFISAMKQRP